LRPQACGRRRCPSVLRGETGQRLLQILQLPDDVVTAIAAIGHVIHTQQTASAKASVPVAATSTL